MGRIWTNVAPGATPPAGALPLNAADLNAMENDIGFSVKPWVASTYYASGQAVISPASGRTVTAIANFTSGTSFNPANWNDPAAGIAAALSIVFGG